MQTFLTTGDLASLTGVPANTIGYWAARRWVDPVNNGRGDGYTRIYSVMQALAAAAGAVWRREGADWPRVEGLVRFVSRMTQEYMEAEFAAGRTFPVPAILIGEEVLPGEGLLIMPQVDLGVSEGARRLQQALDLGAIWEDLKRKLADQAHRNGTDANANGTNGRHKKGKAKATKAKATAAAREG
jgi:hypothetical protein